ncbi:unnamed protein product [Blepharisma stoltei]|uniref:Uncharacterized protein n=1 Tax=Blepharisma stoltei TaxID=1481888 RepID=A0AAU9IL42_9CILI|nr:unnamed protein product [Blepharisma stoltei]
MADSSLIMEYARLVEKDVKFAYLKQIVLAALMILIWQMKEMENSDAFIRDMFLMKQLICVIARRIGSLKVSNV